mmetsp:Transcript_51551/g.102596  ORF Transcript_51551/g.102596 Transcript_51551/m.102596 type:complete len:113 (+) Transcript_51551:217-555(+)
MYCAESDADPGTEYDSLAWVLTQTEATRAAGSVHPSVLLLRLLVARFLYIEQALRKQVANELLEQRGVDALDQLALFAIFEEGKVRARRGFDALELGDERGLHFKKPNFPAN